jgi:hypothetical protein
LSLEAILAISEPRGEESPFEGLIDDGVLVDAILEDEGEPGGGKLSPGGGGPTVNCGSGTLERSFHFFP